MTSVSFHVDQLFSSAPGGMGTYIRQLVPALARAEPSLDITLFHARFGTGPPEEWMKRFEVRELPQSIRRLYPLWAVFGRPFLPPALSGTDLLHAPVPAAVPPKGAGQRLVVTVHDVAFLVHPKLFPPQWRLMYRAGLFRIGRGADAVIAVSRHTAEDLARHGGVPPERVHVVPLAASLPQTTIDAQEVATRLKIPSPYVLFVGTLEPRKNVIRLIRAYRRLVARGAPHALVLAGPIGWRHQQLMKELAVEAPGRIVLTGSTSQADLDALYRGASVFVYPSLYEGFGLPVLEAMARGVPTVVSISSSLPEVAGEAAIPVDPRSVAGLAEAIERVINDRDLSARLRNAGRARAAGFSWDETARQTLEVYKSVL
jgi:glycosyltransferase involved in cell wall biosynthesis